MQWTYLLRHRFLLHSAFLVAVCLFLRVYLPAQTGGQGALEGIITSSDGVPVANASLTALNEESGVITTQTTTSAGVYQITPLIPGHYTLRVSAKDFSNFEQKHIEVNGLGSTGFNVHLRVGGAEQTVVVSDPPPVLQTTNATLGMVITNEVYESLPVLMNSQQRDPTGFATLTPGAQTGTRSPIMSGTGDYLAEVYLDGIPTTTANVQGDNRTISNAIPLEAVDQMQAISNLPSAEYQGAGAISFTTKSGGSNYHGIFADYIRNTAFDTWGFTQAAVTTTKVVNGAATTVPAGKAAEHQNELSASVGGPIPFTRNRGFFFVNYDLFRSSSGVSPVLTTIPTENMREGIFTELSSTKNYIYNPLTNSCSGSTCTRTAFSGNQIPDSYISPIAKYEQKFLPATSIKNVIANNYLASGNSGYKNHELAFKVDYDLTARQRYSFFFANGVRQSVGYGATLPVPYTAFRPSILRPTNAIFEHAYQLTPRTINQLKYGFTRLQNPNKAITDGLSEYSAATAGITGLPAGQASGEFPGAAFSTTTLFTNALTTWTKNGATGATNLLSPNAFTLVDNLSLTKGQHALTFGFETQWLEDNKIAQSSYSGVYTQTFNGSSTAPFSGTSVSTSKGGYSYADFLLGAVYKGSTTAPLYQDIGGRFHPYSPYVQDNWRLRPNLTVSLGLRWDYLPPYHEVADRWSFFNPDAINSLTNTAGQLEYAGYRGSSISCQCRTPVHTYWKNWGPRLGVAWSANEKTVVRAGLGVSYSRGGGVGGRDGDAVGTGQTGFGSSITLPSAVTKGATAGPSYYLNNSTTFTSAGVANTNFGGASYSIPAQTGASSAGLLTNIGNYVNSSGSYVTAGTAPSYADPYLAGRAPEFIFFNFGVQRLLTSNLTLSVNYSGSESHFVAGATISGPWSGKLDPAHLGLLGSVLASDGVTNILAAQATAQNIAIAQAADPSISIPAFYAAAGAVSTTPTIGKSLLAYPQYSATPSALWSNVGNISYNSLQITLAQRKWKGLTYTLNYTYSKNIGDDDTTRASYAVPAAASSNGQAFPGKNRADRDLTDIDQPQNLNVYGVYDLPFGSGHIGSNNALVRRILGGWSAAGIFTYHSGNPLLITDSTCVVPSGVSFGTCMPDVAPGMKNKIRQNGSWGKGLTAKNLGAISYLNPNAFQKPATFSLSSTAISSGATPISKIGTAPRSSLNLWAPSVYNINASLSRSFPLGWGNSKFVFRADCSNLTNKVTFGGISTSWAPAGTTGSTFGQVTTASGNRDFQFSGRITF